MPAQDHYWSQFARDYEEDFIDPFLPDVRDNPLKKTCRRLAERGARVAGDLGCGIGPMLPFLERYYPTVFGVDFAEGMLKRAKEQVGDASKVQFVKTSMLELSPLYGQLDVALAVNSLVMPNVADQDKALSEIFATLKPGGSFVGILPAMDAVHYYLMLLVDRALAAGRPLEAAYKSASHFGDAKHYDFAFGQFRYEGLHQHFWQPFEAKYRFEKAGFHLKKLKKISLSWSQFACAKELKKYPAPWDWFFLATKPRP